MLWLKHWLAQGFRPFFMGAGIWAALAMLHWLHLLAGIGGELSHLTPLAWHRHEMIFGYGGAAMAGFLLTAIPNWTGRLPIKGWPLSALFALWLAGRLGNLASAGIPLLAGMIDSAFWVALIAAILRELIAGGNRKNLPIAGLVAVVGVAAALDHLGSEFAWRLGLGAIAMLILLVGGRVTPSFTRNWLAKQGASPLPAAFGRFDQLALGMAALALLFWVSMPASFVTAWLLCAAGLLHFARLARWQGWRTLAEPLVTILHVGYGWVALGLVLLGIENFYAPPLSAVHALAAGGVAVMTMAVMTRASLGHSGRPLHAGVGIVTIYALLNLGAIMRVTLELWPFPGDWGLRIAGGVWASGFVLYVVLFAPMWLRPRRQAEPRPA